MKLDARHAASPALDGREGMHIAFARQREIQKAYVPDAEPGVGSPDLSCISSRVMASWEMLSILR
jgi:hypothetical protein